jgi:hypothetical protein
VLRTNRGVCAAVPFWSVNPINSLRPILVVLWGILTCLSSSASDNSPAVVLHRAALTSPNQQPGDNYGGAVAIDGNTVVIGATFSNTAYVFEMPASGWKNMTQTAMLTPSDDADHFGASVAISGDTVVIGAPYSTVNGETQQGSVYVFVKPARGWRNMTQTAKLTGQHLDNTGMDFLGNTVSISGSTIAVSVPNVAPNNGALGWGEVLIYVRPPGGWTDTTETAVLYIDPTFYPDYGVGFAASVAISGDTLIVGANGCCDNGQSYVGQAYIYVEPSGGWATSSDYNAELTGTEVQAGDNYGQSVAIAANTVVVGSPQTDTFQVGAAYVYVEPSAGWSTMTQTAELYPLFTLQGNFGQSVAISARQIFIGAPLTELRNSSQGAAYLFVRPAHGWRSTSKFNVRLINNPPDNSFGQSVAISGTTSVVGYSGTFDTNGGATVFWVTP